MISDKYLLPALAREHLEPLLAATLEEAIALIDANAFANGTAIFTGSGRADMHFPTAS